MAYPSRTRISSHLATLICLAVTAVSQTIVHAQPAEWSASEEPSRRQEIIRRYREILAGRPEPGPILDRLVSEVGVGAGLEGLIEDYLALAAQEPDRVAWRLLAGHLLVRSGRLDEARAQFDAALASEPQNVTALRAAGAVAAALDDSAASAGFFERALAAATDTQARREILRQLMDLMFEARQWDAAATWGEQLLALEPDNAFTRLEVAELFVRHGRYEQALEQYEAIGASAGTDTRQRAVAFKDQGDVLVLMGRTEEAVERYRRAMAMVDTGYWLYREAQQQLIDAYRQSGRLSEIVQELEAEWRSPNLSQALLLADLLDETGRDDAAAEVLVSLVQRNPSSLDARLALVRILERSGDQEAVIEQYRALARQQPRDSTYPFRLVDLYRRRGDVSLAVQTLESMARQFRSDTSVLIDVADRLLRLEQAEQASELYELIVRVEPTNPDNWIAAGQFHFVSQRRSEAERTWRRILEIGLPAAEAQATLADVFFDHGLMEEAVIEQQEAVNLEPSNVAFLRSLALMQEQAQRLPVALRSWERVLELATQSQLQEEAREAIVRVHLALGRLPEAVDDFRARFEAEPSDSGAGYLLGLGLTELGRIDDAVQVWQSMVEVDPGDVYALQSLERLYTSQNRIGESVEIIVRLAELQPDRAREYYYRLAELSLRQFDDAAAVRFAQLAVELNPDDPTAHARLGTIYRQMQQYDRAVAAYRQALALDERAFPFYFDLAEIYLVQDRPEAADELYRAVVAQATEEAMVLRAGRRSLRINQSVGTLSDLIAVIEPRLADRQVGDAQLKLIVEVYEAVTAPMAQTARYGEWSEREAALAELQDLGRRAMRPMLDAMSSDDVLLRRRALLVVGEIGNAGAVGPVLRLLNDADEEIRSAAVGVLARLLDERSVELASRALQDARPEHQAALVWGLARGGALAAEPLRGIVGDTGRPASVRALAAVGLARADGSGAVTALSDLLMSSDALLQQAAAVGLGLTSEASAADLLRDWLAHGDARAAHSVAWALAALPFEASTLARLAECEVLAGRELSAACGSALRSLGLAPPSEQALAALDRDLRFLDPATGVFDAARYLEAVMRLDDRHRTALPPVSDVVDTLESVVAGVMAGGRSTAMESLASSLIVDRRGVGLRSWVSGLPPSEAAALMEILAARLAPRSDEWLTAMDGARGGNRGSLIAVAARTAPGSERLRSILRQDLEDANAERVVGALRAAGLTADATWLERVRPHLAHGDWEVRAEAVNTVAALGGDAAEILQVARTDTFASVRLAALQAGMRLDAAAAWEVVDELWSALPASARLALGRDGLTIELLRPMVLERLNSDPDRTVRALATP